MPDLDEPPSAGEQRSTRVLGVLERKLAERENRGAGLDAESLHLRLRIAELRAGVQADPVAAIAVLEPALASPRRWSRSRRRSPGSTSSSAGSEPLIDLAERAASASEPREQRVFWLRRAAEAARAAGAPERAIECYRAPARRPSPRPRRARGARRSLPQPRRRGAARGPAPRGAPARGPRSRAGAAARARLARRRGARRSDRRDSAPAPLSRARARARRAARVGRSPRARCAGGPLAQLDLVEHVCDRADGDAARAALLARRGTLLADALQWNEEAAESWRAALALDPGQPLARERLAALRPNDCPHR